MNIARNTTLNVLEVLVSTLVLFLTSRLIVSNEGLGALGVWSLVVATTTIVKLADVGLGAGIGRAIAVRFTQANDGTMSQLDECLSLVETAILANMLLFSVLAAVAYAPSHYAIGHVLLGNDFRAAIDLLPYSLGVVVATCITSVTGSALTSINRSDQRSIITIGGLLIQLVLSNVWIGKFGLEGVALSQILQGAFVFLSSWVALRRGLGCTKLRLPHRFNLPLLRPLFRYGLKLQSLSIIISLYEPVVKYLLASLGGVAVLGLFEFAFRLTTQLRQLIASPSQNLLPLFIKARLGPNFSEQYRSACAAVWAAGAFAFLALISATPIISRLWLGEVSIPIIVYVAMLSLGWFVNVVSIPAFYVGLASGTLRWNILGSVATTASAILLGWPLGMIFGGIGVVGGASLSIGLGAIIIWIGNSRETRLPAGPQTRDFTAILENLRLRLFG